MSQPVTLKLLDQLMNADEENEHLEFKAATTNFPVNDVVEYVAAIANKKGGYLLLGVTDQVPRRVSDCQSFPTERTLNQLKNEIKNRTDLNVPIVELQHPDGRVLVLDIPSRPRGGLVRTGRKGRILTRSGESLVDMDDEEMRAIFRETESDWLEELATSHLPAVKVLELLEYETIFRLLNQQVPGSAEAICSRLVSLKLLDQHKDSYAITNLGGLTAARRLSAVSSKLALRAPRLIVCNGVNNVNARTSEEFDKGYAVGFEDFVNRAYNIVPESYTDEKLIRTLINMYPIESFRELIANALVHQDFSIPGVKVMIEIYDDRVEFSNPGKPVIETERFIDGFQSRNEVLAKFMRDLRICEERSSGIDKVVTFAELSTMPPPEFRSDNLRTRVTLFGHKPFSDMTKEERVRACYQHCCLLYVSGTKLSNQSLRERFGLSKNEQYSATDIISATVGTGLIKLLDPSTTSLRYARYIPGWTA